MNLALLNPRVWLELACALIIAGVLWYAYHWAYTNGARDVQARFDAYRMQETQMALQQDAANRAKEQALNLSLENLTNAYIKQKNDLATAHAANSSLLESFNAALNAADGAANKDPAAPGGAHASPGPEHDILGSCATTLVKLAEEADRVEAQLVGLQAYVKGVVLK